MRLRPYTTILPKPLLPIGERPILEIILRQLAEAGFTTIDLCVGHLGELIRVYFSEGTVMPEALERDWHWSPGSRSEPPARCASCRGWTARSSS
jgi:NDP-sugar pyrophosphorylase family protein